MWGNSSNYFEYPEEALYDEDARTLFKQITEEMNNGTQVVNRIKSSMRQIKRAYTLTLTRLLTDYFFSNAETHEGLGRLRKDDIEKRVKAAYDLRSSYVHTGINFSRWTHSHNVIVNEVQLGEPIVRDNPGSQRR